MASTAQARRPRCDAGEHEQDDRRDDRREECDEAENGCRNPAEHAEGGIRQRRQKLACADDGARRRCHEAGDHAVRDAAAQDRPQQPESRHHERGEGGEHDGAEDRLERCADDSVVAQVILGRDARRGIEVDDAGRHLMPAARMRAVPATTRRMAVGSQGARAPIARDRRPRRSPGTSGADIAVTAAGRRRRERRCP